MIDYNKIHPIAGMICTILNDYGYPAYLVGGCVRDLLLGRDPKDWDICTSARPENITSRFVERGWTVVPTGIKHGTVTLIEPNLGEQFEVTTFRVDGEYSDGRHPDGVEFTTDIREDLSRRDFTMNAIALGCQPRYHLVDPFSGEADIEAGIIRCVGDPYDRFDEDALRMLRAIRFSCQLDFQVDVKTYEALMDSIQGLSNVSAERMRDELVKIMMTPKAEDGIRMMYDTGAVAWVIPEIEPLPLITQSLPWHLYDVFEHTMHALRALIASGEPVDLATRLAMLYHDTGKPATKTVGEDGICHFYGHPEASAKATYNSLKRLRFDNDTIEEVVSLVLHHDSTFRPERPLIRRLMSSLLSPALFPKLVQIRKADIAGQNLALAPDRIRVVEESFQVYHQVIEEDAALKVTDLQVDGNDVMSYGFKGKQVGEVLKDLLDLVTYDVVPNEREKLLALIHFRIPRDQRTQVGLMECWNGEGNR